METPERRQSKRLKVNLPVSFEHLGTPHVFAETMTKDISVSGLRMNVDGFSLPKTNLLVKLRFPEVNRIVEANAQIVWSQRFPHSDQYQAGLQFSELSPVSKRWLEEYILINETLGK